MISTLTYYYYYIIIRFLNLGLFRVTGPRNAQHSLCVHPKGIRFTAPALSWHNCSSEFALRGAYLYVELFEGLADLAIYFAILKKHFRLFESLLKFIYLSSIKLFNNFRFSISCFRSLSLGVSSTIGCCTKRGSFMRSLNPSIPISPLPICS